MLPMPQMVINQINFKAKGQPDLSIVTYWQGNVIHDTPIDGAQEFNADLYEPPETNGLPGVQIHNDQTDKIPGVDTDSEPMLLEPNFNFGVDFESPVPQEMPLVETSATEQPPTPKSIQVGGPAKEL